MQATLMMQLLTLCIYQIIVMRFWLLFREITNQSTIIYATSAWETGSINNFSVPFASTTNMGVNPMACHYQRFSSSTNIGTAYFTVEITSSDGSGMMLNKITETATGTLSISTVSTSFTRITVQQANFGSTINKLTLIPVNTNSSGGLICYRLTAST